MMINKTWYEQVKEDFTKNIKDTYTLNLAISILEDRKQLLDENLDLKQRLNVVNEIQYCPYNDKCGELYDCSKEEYETMTQSNMKLSLENQQLKERIAYLERSTNRKEEIIIQYRISEKPILNELE